VRRTGSTCGCGGPVVLHNGACLTIAVKHMIMVFGVFGMPKIGQPSTFQTPATAVNGPGAWSDFRGVEHERA